MNPRTTASNDVAPNVALEAAYIAGIWNGMGWEKEREEGGKEGMGRRWTGGVGNILSLRPLPKC